MAEQKPRFVMFCFSVLFGLSELPLIASVKTALKFSSAGTAATTLFALGAILFAHSFAPRKTVCLICAIKLFG